MFRKTTKRKLGSVDSNFRKIRKRLLDEEAYEKLQRDEFSHAKDIIEKEKKEINNRIENILSRINAIEEIGYVNLH